MGHLQVLGEPLGAVLRQWHLQGLPSDKTSVESAIVATTVGTGRWPLLIDPQRQACCWLKHIGTKPTIVARTHGKNLEGTLAGNRTNKCGGINAGLVKLLPHPLYLFTSVTHTESKQDRSEVWSLAENGNASTSIFAQGLLCINAGNPAVMSTLRAAVEEGKCLLVEDVGTAMDPALEPILCLRTFNEVGS